uniref:Uncharacterized protein n=1 Tax=Streptomyces sp. NBC_00003 TaxID=2903608 RepID=A0AAU2VFW2_9ACTN
MGVGALALARDEVGVAGEGVLVESLVLDAGRLDLAFAGLAASGTEGVDARAGESLGGSRGSFPAEWALVVEQKRALGAGSD